MASHALSELQKTQLKQQEKDALMVHAVALYQAELACAAVLKPGDSKPLGLQRVCLNIRHAGIVAMLKLDNLHARTISISLQPVCLISLMIFNS